MTDWSPPSYATVCMQEELLKALHVIGQKESILRVTTSQSWITDVCVITGLTEPFC